MNVKPSWWKEFIVSFRQMLRRVFPKMRISDADINGWLSKAHRAVQQQSAVDKKNLTTENVRYGLQNAQPSKEGYIVEYVNENNGKFFYDHEMIEIEALADSVREETRVELAKMKDKMLADKFGLLYCS